MKLLRLDGKLMLPAKIRGIVPRELESLEDTAQHRYMIEDGRRLREDYFGRDVVDLAVDFGNLGYGERITNDRDLFVVPFFGVLKNGFDNGTGVGCSVDEGNYGKGVDGQLSRNVRYELH